MTSTSSDSELVELISRARHGEPSARVELLEHYRNYLALLARIQIDCQLQGRVSPSDLVQETVIEAERQFDQFRGSGEAELIAWLRRVLATRVAQVYRRHSAQKRDYRIEQQVQTDIEKSNCHLGGAIDVRRASPSQAVARREEEVLLADAMGRLADDHREVILLRSMEDLPFEVVARRMGRSIPSVRSLWARALVKLRDALENPS